MSKGKPSHGERHYTIELVAVGIFDAGGLEIRPSRAMMESTILVAVGFFWGGEQELAAGAPLAIREPALGAAFAWVGSGRSGASGRARPSILCFASN
jgi:hypothetical protein